MKQLPNLIDMNEIRVEVKNTIFKKTSYRVNIILGLIFIFTVLLFIYFGINSKRNISSEEVYEQNEEIEPIYYEEEQINQRQINPADLALM